MQGRSHVSRAVHNPRLLSPELLEYVSDEISTVIAKIVANSKSEDGKNHERHSASA